jgi:hypothetical protein
LAKNLWNDEKQLSSAMLLLEVCWNNEKQPSSKVKWHLAIDEDPHAFKKGLSQ